MPQRAAPLAGLELLGGTRSTGDEMPCGKEEVSRTSSSKKESGVPPAASGWEESRDAIGMSLRPCFQQVSHRGTEWSRSSCFCVTAGQVVILESLGDRCESQDRQQRDLGAGEDKYSEKAQQNQRTA